MLGSVVLLQHNVDQVSSRFAPLAQPPLAEGTPFSPLAFVMGSAKNNSKSAKWPGSAPATETPNSADAPSPDVKFILNLKRQQLGNVLKMDDLNQRRILGSASLSSESINSLPTLSSMRSFSALNQRDELSPSASSHFDIRGKRTISLGMAKALNIACHVTSPHSSSSSSSCSSSSSASRKFFSDILSPVSTASHDSGIMHSRSGSAVSLLTPAMPRDSSGLSLHSFPSSPLVSSPVDGADAWLLNGQTKRMEKLMRTAFGEINETCKQLNLGQKIVAGAKQIYWAAKSQNLCRGKSNDAMSGAAVYFSCRQESTPRTFHEIASASTASKRDIGRCYKELEKYLKTKSMSKMTTEDMIGRICDKLVFEKAGDSAWIKEKACLIARSVKANNLVASKSPLSVAATAVFMIVITTNPTRLRIAKDMAKTSGVSEVTLRNTYREFYMSRRTIMPICEVITTADIEAMPSLQSNTSS